VRGTLKDVYVPVDDFGQERKPSLQSYPEIPWDKSNWTNSTCSRHIASTAQASGRWLGNLRIIPWSPGAAVLTDASFAP